MSDVMLLGVLRMPLPDNPDPLTLAQLAGWARQAADRIERDAEEIERLRHSVAFYRRRCDLLQAWQRRMRDPERTLVCDILANGQTMPDPNGMRYPLEHVEQQRMLP